MLSLKDIHKEYGNTGNIVPALKGISIDFRKNEFVSILGPSGCGKTTLLNIVGGLDKYSKGDLIINGKSTKQYLDKDWDAYRNRTIGFVFQDYNLISHLTVLGNVELALTLSGISPKERKIRATEALTKVGLGTHITKMPNQLSGGQKQRVAIARAIINNPSIILADEPTGALDTKTSIQIMDILQEIAKDRLVIMVTHNNELAEQYSTRIIKLLDGKIVEDSNPFDAEKDNIVVENTKPKTSMSFFTAFKLSLRNLWTKKARTILTAFAGSIGIIGIALVLAMSTGFSNYINTLQTDTLATMPITIGKTALNSDLMSISKNMQEEYGGDNDTSTEITTYDPTATSLYHKNTITTEYLDYLDTMDSSLYSNIVKKYGMRMHIMVKNGTTYDYIKSSMLKEISIANSTQLAKEYPLVVGSYPTKSDEVLLLVNTKNQISSYTLEKLGLNESGITTYTAADFIGKEYKAVANDQYYYESSGNYMQNPCTQVLYDNASNTTLTIVGVAQYETSMFSGGSTEGIAYNTLLSEEIHSINMTSAVVVAQNANNTTYIASDTIGTPGTTILSYIDTSAGITYTAQEMFEQALQMLGGSNIPSSISIYSNDFESKNTIKAFLNNYNNGKEEADYIIYSDYAEMITDTFNSIIDSVSIVLVIFASISLIVSSIMIGIITYVSVIERTKEIGVLRSLGARKKDIARVFNAETVLIGLTAGLFGILLTLVLTLPLNSIIASLASGVNINATLNPLHGLLLIVLSMALTFIAGLIPSRIASKKDPVRALRNE